MIGGAIGLSCTFVLQKIAQPHFEIAVWTVLVEAAVQNGSSPPSPISISLLDSWIESVGLMGAFRVLRYRSGKRSSSNLASLWCLLLFILSLLLSTGIGFFYARCVDLNVRYAPQETSSSWKPVLGTLTQAEQSVDEFKPYGPADPPSAALEALNPENNHTVYFPEIFRAVVEPEGYGYGAYRDVSRL